MTFADHSARRRVHAHTLDRRALGCIGPPTDKDAVGEMREFACEGGKRVIVGFKREPGTSPPWIVQHVGARKDTVIREIEGAGFRSIEDRDFMKGNYFLRFQKDRPEKMKAGSRRPSSRPVASTY